MTASPKPDRQRSTGYRKSMRDEACWCCGATDQTVVGAHNRRGQTGGTGLKPSDEYIAARCARCHATEHSGKEQSDWVWRQVLNHFLRNKYWNWRKDND